MGPTAGGGDAQRDQTSSDGASGPEFLVESSEISVRAPEPEVRHRRWPPEVAVEKNRRYVSELTEGPLHERVPVPPDCIKEWTLGPSMNERTSGPWRIIRMASGLYTTEHCSIRQGARPLELGVTERIVDAIQLARAAALMVEAVIGDLPVTGDLLAAGLWVYMDE